MLNKRFNALTLALVSVACSAVAVTVVSLKDSDTESSNSSGSGTCEVVTRRLDGYKFVKPILYNNPSCESPLYQSLKNKVDETITQLQQSGSIDKASVYFKNLATKEYFGINDNEMYHPASLIKLPILIAYMQMEENAPGILNKKIVFHIPPGGLPPQTYTNKQIEPEKSYTIKELLRYMVAYSDNNATFLLNENLDLNIFTRMFADLGLPVPNVQDQNFQISAKDYSVFLNVVYNAGYLSISHCEFVAELLNECDFKLGIQAGIPSNINLIHKFGEFGIMNKPDFHQLSESAIIYLNNSPYLLTEMTKGKENNNLTSDLGAISKKV